MENYSLLMGDSSVMKMAVESMEKPSGALPVPACRNRLLSPRSWLRDGGGSELFSPWLIRIEVLDKTLLDTTCSGSFTRNKEEFKRDLLDRIKENAEDWENDKGKESGYADKPPFKPLPPKEGNEEKEEKKKKKGTKKKKKENKKKEVTAYHRVNEITLGKELDEAEELLARISQNHDDWTTPEPTPTPVLKNRGMIELNDEDMREAKKSLMEKGIKSEDVKNLPPIEDLCTAKKIEKSPKALSELYREVTNDDSRTIQRGKIRNIQLPAIRYFAYDLATSILGRENTSNISSYHLAFLVAALTGNTPYHLGDLIARRLSTRGPIYGGIIASRIFVHLDLPLNPTDEKLTPVRLDIAAMKSHQFVTTDSGLENIVYNMLFIDGDEKEIPLPQADLFSVHRKPWSRSKEEVDEHLRIHGFHQQHDSEDAEPSYGYTVTYPGNNRNGPIFTVKIRGQKGKPGGHGWRGGALPYGDGCLGGPPTLSFRLQNPFDLKTPGGSTIFPEDVQNSAATAKLHLGTRNSVVALRRDRELEGFIAAITTAASPTTSHVSPIHVQRLDRLAAYDGNSDPPSNYNIVGRRRWWSVPERTLAWALQYINDWNNPPLQMPPRHLQLAAPRGSGG
ncbi:hypothetical protein QYE76_009686 [Lolium multiflorum]|uniref:Uncharacterized protein n=1 Tax=Lolium multiflorum TaxID=4521 RepID=A0AAD8X3T7_LOLMU|nr:hypothetical protein QYE76_009686 [Lolium multiflorum]